MDVLLLVVAAALVPIAGLLAAADAAITMVSPARLEEMAREGRRGAHALLVITEDRPRYTNLLLLLRTGAEITATVMVAKVALSTWGFQFWVGVLLVAVMVLVTYVAIGVLPRTLGRQHPYAIGLPLAGPTRALAKVLAPVASVLILIGNAITPGRGFREGPFSSDIELRELVDIAGSRGVVEETEREMLQSVFDLGDTIVREVMVPRTEVVWIEEDKTLRQALHLATRSGFSRIPVVGEDVDDVLGVAYIKDMIARALALDPGERGPLLGEVMRTPVFVPESKNVDALLREMQRDRTHFAVVVDEYGGTAGIVTIEDLLEEIVGEITDEYDAETPAPIEPLPDGSFRVSSRLPVEDLGELFDVELPTDDVDTVGGLLAQLLGRVPLPGSEASVNALHLLGEPGVDRRGRPRVQTLLVRRMSPDEPGIEVEDDVPGRREGRPDKPVKLDKTVKPEKTDKAERVEKADRAGKAEKAQKSEKTERAEKADRAARADKPTRSDKPVKTEKAGKSDRGVKAGQVPDVESDARTRKTAANPRSDAAIAGRESVAEETERNVAR
jgi:CBS domain containing-hemolysin-like protein